MGGDSLAAYARAAEANARAHHYADVFAADLVELAAWLGHSGVVSWHEQIKAAAARVYGDPCAKEIESADLDDYRGQSPDDAIVAIVGGWSRAGTK